MNGWSNCIVVFKVYVSIDLVVCFVILFFL